MPAWLRGVNAAGGGSVLTLEQRDAAVTRKLFPGGEPTDKEDLDRLFELYKIMVASSEALVARRQGVNTFFLTINGVLLTAASLILGNAKDHRLVAVGLTVLAFTGGFLCVSWNTLLKSFGQLNTGKFAVINKIEKVFPGAIFDAEWTALGEGLDPKIYRSFTSREVFTPRLFVVLYAVAFVIAFIIAVRMQ